MAIKCLFLGVDLFFVISGYVVTKSFVAKRLDIRYFWLKRVFRIYPMLIAFILVAAIENAFCPHFAARWSVFLHDALSVLLSVMTIVDTDGLYWNGAMWSLSIEMQFYLVWPLIVLALAAFSSQGEKRRGPRYICSVALHPSGPPAAYNCDASSVCGVHNLCDGWKARNSI